MKLEGSAFRNVSAVEREQCGHWSLFPPTGARDRRKTGETEAWTKLTKWGLERLL